MREARRPTENELAQLAEIKSMRSVASARMDSKYLYVATASNKLRYFRPANGKYLSSVVIRINLDRPESTPQFSYRYGPFARKHPRMGGRIGVLEWSTGCLGDWLGDYKDAVRQHGLKDGTGYSKVGRAIQTPKVVKKVAHGRFNGAQWPSAFYDMLSHLEIGGAVDITQEINEARTDKRRAHARIYQYFWHRNRPERFQVKKGRGTYVAIRTA